MRTDNTRQRPSPWGPTSAPRRRNRHQQARHYRRGRRRTARTAGASRIGFWFLAILAIWLTLNLIGGFIQGLSQSLSL